MTEPNWRERVNQIRGCGFTLKAAAKHTGINVPTLYKLSSGDVVKLTADNWSRLDNLYNSLKTAGVLK